jgi:hypothetical protein
MLAHLGPLRHGWARMAQPMTSRRYGGIAIAACVSTPSHDAGHPLPDARRGRRSEALVLSRVKREAVRSLHCARGPRAAAPIDGGGCRTAAPVCGPRAFYGLMTLDETGVLCARATRRGEAERDPLHPIRVIPAREVSGSQLFFHSPAGQRPSLDVPFARPASPAGFVLGYVRLLPYGKDTMTAHSSVYCFVRRPTAHAALRVSAGPR